MWKRGDLMKSQFVLVSFCNNPELTVSPVLCVKIPASGQDVFEYAPMNLGFPGLINHATGLTTADKMILVAFHSEGRFYISGLDQNDLTPVFYQHLPEVRDIHSILASDNCLYVVSTGTDEVLAYDILANRLENPRVIWYASMEKKDTHHLNSIVENQGDLFISAFGPKSENLWASAPNGYIHNITSDSRVKDDIYHPHSLSVRNKQLYFCESHMGTFCSLDKPIFKLPGYSRGVGWLSDDKVCVTTSIGRTVSRSTGQIGNPGDPGESAGQCGLTVKKIKNDRLLTVDFSWFGPEIYDVLVLSSQQLNLFELAIMAQKAERRILQLVIKEKSHLEQEKTQLVQEKTQLVQEKTQLVQEKTQLEQEKTQLVQEKTQLEQEKTQLVQEKVQLDQAVAEKNNKVLALSKQIFDIYQSRSWRWTEPIRKFFGMFRRMK
jgi:hypothetical protein